MESESSVLQYIQSMMRLKLINATGRRPCMYVVIFCTVVHEGLCVALTKENYKMLLSEVIFVAAFFYLFLAAPKMTLLTKFSNFYFVNATVVPRK